MGLKHSSDQKKSSKIKIGFSRCLTELLPLAEISAGFSLLFVLGFGISEGFVFFLRWQKGRQHFLRCPSSREGCVGSASRVREVGVTSATPRICHLTSLSSFPPNKSQAFCLQARARLLNAI